MVKAFRRFDLNPDPGFRGGHMRQLFALPVLLFCCGLASAQDAWTPPGQYAEPSAPRLSTPVASPGALPTPFLTLDTPPLAVGASNSTLENATGSPVYYNQPLLYQPGVQYNSAIPVSSSSARNLLRWLADDTGSSWVPRPFRWTMAWPNWRASVLERKQKRSTPTRTSPESTKPTAQSNFVASWST